MTKWQTIETAPKDGSEILAISTAHKGPLILAWRHYNGCWGWRDWDWDLHLASNVTHWMPLPEPPLTPDPRQRESTGGQP